MDIRYTAVLAVTLLAFLGQVCAEAPKCAEGVFPVEWVSTYPEKLRGSGTKAMGKLVLSGAEYTALLALDDASTARKNSPAISCADYIKKNPAITTPDSAGEWSWHGASWESSRFLRDCLILNLIQSAKSAPSNCISGFILAPSVIHLLPSTMGLVVSTEEEREMAEDKPLTAWAPKMKFSVLKSDEGVNELVGVLKEESEFEEDHFSAVAFGDFNADGYQDVLLTIRDLSEGRYGELRLAVLSRKNSAAMLTHAFRADK